MIRHSVWLLLGAVLLGGLVSLAQIPPAQRGSAGSGIDLLTVQGSVNIASRLGYETIALEGMATVSRSESYESSGQHVIAMEVLSLSLTGESLTGPVSVSHSEEFASSGAIVAIGGDQFPAQAYFDVFIEAAVPASGTGTPAPWAVHNETALHMVAGTIIDAWPAPGVTFTADPEPPGALSCHEEGGIALLPANPALICVTQASFTIIGAQTATPTRTHTPTLTQTYTPTMTPTPSPTYTPTATAPSATQTITSTATKTPTPTRTPRRTPTPTITETATSVSTTTATHSPPIATTATATETVTVSATPSATAPIRLGDPTCDGMINALDALAALQYTAGLIAGGRCAGAGDVNQDAAVDARDAALILQFDAGLIIGFPAARSR